LHTISKSRLKIGKLDQYKTFEILFESDLFRNNVTMKNRINNNPIHSESTVSIEQFAFEFQQIMDGDKLKHSTIDKIFKLLKNSLPSINWPIRDNLRVNLMDYIHRDHRLLQYDVCPNSSHCCVFVGEYKKLQKCPICNTVRFQKCTRCKVHECNHVYKRTPFQRIWYRPILSLVHDLLKYESFISAINYECNDYRNYYISDVSTGQNYQKNLIEMKHIYNSKNYSSEVVMINLLISEFYDGIQLFKTRIQNFWPLMISILNLPLSMRVKCGVGTFIISLFTGKLDTPAERFLLEECLCEELVAFGNGIEIHVDNKIFFVQIRLISTILDTKGFEETMHVKGVGSYDGCFICNVGKGFSYGHRQIHMIDHRTALPINHFLRSIGQKECCCPVDYYNYNATKVNRTSNKLINSTLTSDKFDNDIIKSKEIKFSRDINIFKKEMCCLKNLNEVNTLFNFFSSNDFYLWYHGLDKFNYKAFNEKLWYNYCNYIEQTKYERKTTNEYYSNYEYCIDNKLEAYKGVKDIWHLYRLNYANVSTDLCWDPFHCVSNIIKSIVANWRDNRFDKYPIEYCKKNEMHNYLYVNNEHNIGKNCPWFINANTRNLVDSCIFEMLVPSGLSDDFQFKHTNLFAQFGHLRGTSVIQIGTVLMKLILTLVGSQFPEQYRLYYLMLYEDLNLFMSPVFKNKQSIEDLKNKVLELITLGQGLFPPSEFRLIHHQLYCISNHLEQGGSVKNFWAISGERIMGFIKNCVPIGGPAYDLTAIRKYSKYENSLLHDFYSKPFENIELIDKSLKLTYDKINNIARLNLFENKLKKLKANYVMFQEGLDSFLHSLISIIKKKYKNFSEAIINSKYFKLFYDFKTYLKENKNAHTSNSFKFYDYIIHIMNNMENLMCEFCKNIYNFINNTVICTYENAIIYGTEFVSVSKPNSDMYKDDLILNWNSSSYYSSWFKFRDNYDRYIINSENDNSFGLNSWKCYNRNKNKISNKESYSYGQFNYFFEIKYFPDDNLNNVLMGCSITRHIHSADYKKNYFVDCINIEDSFRNDLFFIDLADVIPTRVLTLGMDREKLPIKNRTGIRSKEHTFYSKLNIPKLLYFLDLDEKNKYIMS
jgi:hypothetical protein